jgi:hypothetical protein
VRSSSAFAIAWSAAFFVSVSSRASVREARLAPAQISATDCAVVAIWGKGTGRGVSRRDRSAKG